MTPPIIDEILRQNKMILECNMRILELTSSQPMVYLGKDEKETE